MDSKSSLTTLSIFLTKRRILALPALGILAVSAATLSAQTAQTWTAGTGDWTTGSNWSPAGDPNSAAADLYATSGTSVVNLNSSRTAGRVTIGSGDEVNVQNGYYLMLAGSGFSGAGTLVNNGTFRLSGTNSTTAINLGDANNQTITFSGSGDFIMADSTYNYILSGYGGITLVNDTNISGAGNIGNGNILNLVNNGSIRATGTNTLNLYLNGSGTFTNNGTLRAEAGSRLNFLPVGTFNNTGNTVTADGAGAELFIGYSSIFNSGTFAGINGGKTILESASTLNSVSLVGAAEIRNGYYSTIFTGTTTVSGTLAVSGSSSTTGMSLGNANGQTVTLAGPGAIELSDSGNNYILTSYGGITLVNETNISGAGNIGNGNIQSVLNNGSILAMGTNNLNLYLNGSGTFANNGTLGGQDGQLRVVGNWTFFTNYNNGTQTLTGGTWVATDTGAPGSEEIEFTDPSKQVLINNATISLSGSSAFIRGVSGVTNQNSGTLSISNGQVFTTNTGTMTNTGSLLVTQGAVLNAEYVSTGGSLVMDSGSIDDSAFLSGASIFEGNGTVEGDFTAAGTTNIIPGSGIGTLALQNGNYLQTGGQITLDIARLGGVPTQDAITALNGAVTVSDTTIELNLLAGSQTLHVGDTFTVLQANFLNVGDDLTLTNINYVFGSSLSSYTFSTNVNGDALSFTVLTVPEPSTMVLLGVGLGVLALRSRKRASRA